MVFQRGNPVVLVVEDEAMILLDTVDMLENAGVTAIEAANARQALSILEDQSGVDVVFTDIDMPGDMNGLALAAEIRSRWPAIPVILTSGHMKPELHQLPPETSFFSKPYNQRELLTKISGLISSG
ncbi:MULTISPECIES: response regulator [Devosia]|jgi:two-component system, response regulator PdtaR|uniref:Response regulator n=2 Tax=Devosia TaxID=46913 RepID=A0A942E9V9_9HYPH|nr:MULTISPECIES: response regulator [Devosia]MBS3848262.1 response regulator [Devosia litorisediminis]MCZ4345226.1 response regulator [Devosia neptuniae]|tara:strand:- start:20731 stop:21108 length:378 start_codon:yes stop_codon:yes gene_type:complete